MGPGQRFLTLLLALGLVIFLHPLLAHAKKFSGGIDPKELNQEGISVLGMLEDLDKKIDSLRKTAEETRKKQREVKLFIAEAEKLLTVRAEALKMQKRRLETRLRHVYKVQRGGGMEYLLGARGVSDYAQRKFYLDRLVEADRQLIRGYLDNIRFVTEYRKKLTDNQEDLTKLVKNLEAEEAKIAAQAKKKRSILEAIRRDEALRRKAEAEAERARQEAEEALRKKALLAKDDDLAPPSNQAPSTVMGLAREEPTVPLTGLAKKKGSLRCPTKGVLETGYGTRVTPLGGASSFHGGLDLRAKKGTAIHAISEGLIRFAGRVRGYGNLLIVEHGEGFHSLYAHLNRLDKAEGQRIKTGERIGDVGDTGSVKGSYLYFEIRYKGKQVNPSEYVRCK